MGRRRTGSEKRILAFRIAVCAIAALVTALAGHGVQSLMGGSPSVVVSGAAAAVVASLVFVATAPGRG